MYTNCLMHSNPETGEDSDTMSRWSDEALIRWILANPANDGRSLSLLIQRHQPRIRRRCLFRLGNLHDAEDATQDILLRVQTRLAQFAGRSRFTTWLNVIIDNYCNTFAKRRARYQSNDDVEQRLESSNLNAIADPCSALSDSEVVQQLLSRLNVNDREVLMLRFFDEATLEEMAITLDLRLSATKARLYRSIERFRRHYQQLDGN